MPSVYSWKILYYQSLIQQNSPVQEFLESLNVETIEKVYRTFTLLQEYGIQVGFPYVKKLNNIGLWELRIAKAQNVRIFYVLISDKTFLLLHGFIKKKQKTDKKEIRTALQRLREYLDRRIAD